MEDKNVYIIATENGHQKDYADAIQHALKKHNINCVRLRFSWQLPKTAQIVCLWGWRRGPDQVNNGRNVLVVERGFIERMDNCSLSFNGLNGFADFCEDLDNQENFERFKYLIKPWKKDDNFKKDRPALILGQTPNDASLRGKNLDPWYDNIAKDIRELYGVDVIFRPHPNVLKKNTPLKYLNMEVERNKTLEQLLDECSFAVTFNSNSAVDALMNGTPIVVYDQCSMLYGICPKNIFDVDFKEPDREKILKELVNKQYSLEEVKEGSWVTKFKKYFSKLEEK